MMRAQTNLPHVPLPYVAPQAQPYALAPQNAQGCYNCGDPSHYRNACPRLAYQAQTNPIPLYQVQTQYDPQPQILQAQTQPVHQLMQAQAQPIHQPQPIQAQPLQARPMQPNPPAQDIGPHEINQGAPARVYTIMGSTSSQR